MQMDSVSPNGHQLYRYIHLHTADVPETLEAVHKMAMEFSAKKSEALPAAVNFAYVSTLASGDDPFADHWVFVHNHKAVSILHLNISLKNTDDPATDYHFISPILYQEGAPFIPRGAPNTLRLGAGKYAATIQSQDGSFFEILELKKSMTGLKREIRVYKLSHSDQGRRKIRFCTSRMPNHVATSIPQSPFQRYLHSHGYYSGTETLQHTGADIYGSPCDSCP